jgi:hypothetical protein
MRLVFRRVGVLLAAGLALGLAGSLWGSRFVEALLFQLEARDPVTFVGAAVVLVAVGVLAAWMGPSRRARRSSGGASNLLISACLRQQVVDDLFENLERLRVIVQLVELLDHRVQSERG